jgi:CHC2 zinc finger
MKNTDPPLSPAESLRYYKVKVPKLHKSGRELRAPCPIHHGKRDSFSVNPQTGAWFCHSGCQRGGGAFEFEAAVSGVDFKHAREEVLRIVGRVHSSNGTAKRAKVAEYSYVDEKGKVLFQCVRYEPKDFRQRRPDGRGGWIWNLEGVRLVLYRLPQVLAAPLVFIVEGEKDVQTLERLGFVATCNAMGAEKWRKQYADTLRGKNVVVIPDADDPGRKHVATIVRSLEGVARSVKLLPLPDAKDVTEWTEHGGTREALTRLVEQAAPGAQSRAPHTNGHPVPELTPIAEKPVAPRGDSRQSNEPGSGITPGVVPWPDPIGEAGMFGLAGDFVRLVQKDTEADPNILLLTFLVYAGNMLGRTVYSTAGGDKHCTNLYLAIVGTTSHGRKGSAVSVVEAFFLRGDGRVPGLANVLYGISSGEGLIWEIKDPITKEECDRKTGKTEIITVDQGNKDKRLLVSLGEFFQCLAAMRRKENSLSSLLRTGWDRDVLQSPVKNSPAKATGAHLSIVACISKDELLRAIDTGDADNGTLNRFLWACSKRSRLLPQGGKLFDTIKSDEWGKLQAKFNRVSLAPGEYDNAAVQRDAASFSRDAEANADWGLDENPDCGLYKKLTEPRTGMWGSITARSAAQVLRLSLLEAALNGSRVIRRVHQEAALEIWRYCEQSAKYIFGDRLDDPTAQAIMLALREAGDAGLTRHDISAIFQRNRDGATIQASLIWLSQAGLVRCEKRDEGARGRPSERWFAL